MSQVQSEAQIGPNALPERRMHRWHHGTLGARLIGIGFISLSVSMLPIYHGNQIFSATKVAAAVTALALCATSFIAVAWPCYCERDSSKPIGYKRAIRVLRIPAILTALLLGWGILHHFIQCREWNINVLIVLQALLGLSLISSAWRFDKEL